MFYVYVDFRLHTKHVSLAATISLQDKLLGLLLEVHLYVKAAHGHLKSKKLGVHKAAHGHLKSNKLGVHKEAHGHLKSNKLGVHKIHGPGQCYYLLVHTSCLHFMLNYSKGCCYSSCLHFDYAH